MNLLFMAGPLSDCFIVLVLSHLLAKTYSGFVWSFVWSTLKSCNRTMFLPWSCTCPGWHYQSPFGPTRDCGCFLWTKCVRCGKKCWSPCLQLLSCLPTLVSLMVHQGFHCGNFLWTICLMERTLIPGTAWCGTIVWLIEGTYVPGSTVLPGVVQFSVQLSHSSKGLLYLLGSISHSYGSTGPCRGVT